MLKDESVFLDSNIWLYAFIRDKVGGENVFSTPTTLLGEI